MSDALIRRLRTAAHPGSVLGDPAAPDTARLLSALAEALAQLEEERARNAAVQGWLIDWPDEPGLGHYFAEAPSPNARSRALVLRDTAPSLAIIPGAKP